MTSSETEASASIWGMRVRPTPIRTARSIALTPHLVRCALSCGPLISATLECAHRTVKCYIGEVPATADPRRPRASEAYRRTRNDPHPRLHLCERGRVPGWRGPHGPGWVLPDQPVLQAGSDLAQPAPTDPWDHRAAVLYHPRRDPAHHLGGLHHDGSGNPDRHLPADGQLRTSTSAIRKSPRPEGRGLGVFYVQNRTVSVTLAQV